MGSSTASGAIRAPRQGGRWAVGGVAKGADALAVTMLGAAGDTDALVACAKRGSRAATLIGAVLTCPHAKCAASLKALAKRKAVIKAFGTAGSAALVKLL